MTVRTTTLFLVAWALCLAALIAFHVAYIRPRDEALDAARREARAQSDRFTLLTNTKSPGVQERIKARQAELERQCAEFVFGSDEMSKLDFVIRGIAEKNGLQDFSARRTSTVSSMGTTKFRQIAQSELVLSFAGSFRGMVQFVNDLERHQPAVFVDQFTLRGASNKNDALTCDMECSVLYRSTVK
jgi:hypothetical protein